MKMIGLAEKIEVLYHLILKDKNRDAFSVNNTFVCTLPNFVLWHFRLGGHLSPTRMNLLFTPTRMLFMLFLCCCWLLLKCNLYIIYFPLLLTKRLYVIFATIISTRNFLMFSVLINSNISILPINSYLFPLN